MSNSFVPKLQAKIELLTAKRQSVQLGSLEFSSRLLLAPMAGICSPPFRLLMEKLGAGGVVSELVSCHGINHGNQRTRHMLRVHPEEKMVGLQLFGEEAEEMNKAALIAESFGPRFIDINMGCPVRKVVTKGGGAALLQDPSKLGHFFATIKKNLSIPLSIKIRTGWDHNSLNALEICHIAREEGVEFVAIHGRTRAQQYRGDADWEYLEYIAQQKIIPLIGNGDLHHPGAVRSRLEKSACQALMLARGPLRFPFIFLESFLAEGEKSPFSAQDYWFITRWLSEAIAEHFDNERILLVQLRKHLVWFATGWNEAANFRQKVYQTQSLGETLQIAEEYFLKLEEEGAQKKVPENEASFMTSGHG